MRRLDHASPINWNSPLNRGLLRWWLCLPDRNRGNVWRDLTRRNDATIKGATVAGSRGRPGGWGCYQYNGTSNAAQTAAINLSSVSTLTVSFWLWWDAYGTNDDLTLETSANANSNLGAFFIDPNMGGSSDVLIVVNTNGTNFSGVQFARTNASATAWNHWVVCMDRNAGAQQVTAVYINGRSISLSNTFTNTGSSGGFGNYDWNFMARNNGALLQGAGKLDDVRIYNRVLMSSEVKEQYRDAARGNRKTLRWLPARNARQADAAVGSALLKRMQTEGLFVGGAA